MGSLPKLAILTLLIANLFQQAGATLIQDSCVALTI